ncbi:MAG: mechanosensitive ion channel domain-containing protein [Actinomycetota bacterium]
MTTTEWITIAGSAAGGILIGLIAARIVTSVIGSPSRPEPIRNAARPLSSLAFWTATAVGLVVALGIGAPNALSQLPQDVVDYLPRVMSAAIVLIVANVAASFAQAALAPAVGRMSAGTQRRLLGGVRTGIIGLAVLLAVRQLGFDTTVINIAVAAVLFGLAGAMMLLIALGGRDVAVEVASTRVIQRLIKKGDRIRIDVPGGPASLTTTIAGRVVALHPTAVELETLDGETVLVPASRFVAESFTVDRATSSGGSAGGDTPPAGPVSS